MDASKSLGYQDFEWAMKLNRYSLKLIGLWPNFEESTCKKFVYNFRPLAIVLMLVLCILIPSIASLIRIRTNIMCLIDNLQFTLPAITCAVRIVVLWWKREAVVLVLRMVVEDWLRLKSDKERKIMIARARTARIIIICAYSAMSIVFFFTTLLPIWGVSMRYITNVTDPGRPLPIQTYYPYDVTKKPQYELTYVVQIVGILISIMSYTGIDNFLGLIVLHICGQLDILRDRIVYFDEFIDFRDVLKNSVADHTRLLRAIAMIEDTFNIILLILFLYFGVLFACYGFLVITLIEKGYDMSIARLIYQISIILNTFGHMCVYCAVGEILVAQCDQIYYTIYNFKWYTLEPKDAKSVILLLIRSSKPVYLTAGKLFPMSMATFCNLLKTSASYISILLTTRN